MRCPNCLSGDRPVCNECGKPWIGSVPTDPGAAYVAVKASELEELVARVEDVLRNGIWRSPAIGEIERLERSVQPFRRGEKENK